MIENPFFSRTNEWCDRERLLLIFRVLTLLEKPFKLVFIFEAGLQVSQEHMSSKQRLQQHLQCCQTAVDHLSCSVIHLNQPPLT